MQYVWIVQTLTSKESSLHYNEIPEGPEYKFVSIHTTLQHANRAAKAYARDAEDLPGAGERLDENIEGTFDRDGCWSCGLDLLEYADTNEDMADVTIEVKRKPLLGPILPRNQPTAIKPGPLPAALSRPSAIPLPALPPVAPPSHLRTHNDNRETDEQRATKLKVASTVAANPDDDEVQFIKEVKK